jgi:hypothetical protein
LVKEIEKFSRRVIVGLLITQLTLSFAYMN